MTVTSPHPTLTYASDVYRHIVSLNDEIEEAMLLVYEEGTRWREQENADGVSTNGLHDAIRQDPHRRDIMVLERRDVLSLQFQQLRDHLTPSQLLGVASLVKSKQHEPKHIPMMDFICPPNESNADLLASLLAEGLRMPGFLLDSGRSFHFYGVQLLSEVEWRRFIGKCVLMSGLVDDRYVGHQLVDGYCVLRISSSLKKKRVPIVRRFWGP
jgi:hypothetical protein